MSNKSNFAQALRELTGFDGKAGGAENGAAEPSAGRVPVEFDSDPAAFEAAPVSFDLDESAADGEAGKTVVTATMKITGDVKSDDDLLVSGEVFGNISTTGALKASSLIVGDIKAANAAFDHVRLKGSANVRDSFNISEGSVIVGDVAASNLKLSGKIKGNVNVGLSALLLGRALVVGDVSADELSMEAGARINGNVAVKGASPDVDEDAEFNLGGDF